LFAGEGIFACHTSRLCLGDRLQRSRVMHLPSPPAPPPAPPPPVCQHRVEGVLKNYRRPVWLCRASSRRPGRGQRAGKNAEASRRRGKCERRKNKERTGPRKSKARASSELGRQGGRHSAARLVKDIPPHRAAHRANYDKFTKGMLPRMGRKGNRRRSEEARGETRKTRMTKARRSYQAVPSNAEICPPSPTAAPLA